MSKQATNPVGTFIRARLDDLRMSPTELAAEVGVSRASVYRWLDSDRPFRPQDSLDLLGRLAIALRVDEDALSQLWRGDVDVVEASFDETDRVLLDFKARHSGLSAQELRDALALAEHALELVATQRPAKSRRRR